MPAPCLQGGTTSSQGWAKPPFTFLHGEFPSRCGTQNPAREEGGLPFCAGGNGDRLFQKATLRTLRHGRSPLGLVTSERSKQRGLGPWLVWLYGWRLACGVKGPRFDS